MLNRRMKYYASGTAFFCLFYLIIGCVNDRKEKSETSVNEIKQLPASIQLSDSLTNKDEVTNAAENKKVVLEKKSDASKSAEQKIEVKTFENKDRGGFGYDIMIDGKVYVHQPNIPAIPGNNGFNSENNARKVGLFVVEKIRNHIMPPTVDTRELDSLGVK